MSIQFIVIGEPLLILAIWICTFVRADMASTVLTVDAVSYLLSKWEGLKVVLHKV